MSAGWGGYNSQNPYSNLNNNNNNNYNNNNNNNSYAGPSYPTQTASSSSYSASNSVYDPYAVQEPSFDTNAAEQSSIYTPQAAARGGYTMANTAATTASTASTGKGRKTVMRKAGGTLWEDPTLMEWDPTHFRLFVGDLDPALSDDVFQTAFSGSKYPSFVKARIVRDKFTKKGKGFGFVSYKDPEDFLRAWKDLNGKYVGSRPVTISKATTGVGAVEIGDKKARAMDLLKKAKSGTKPYERAKLAEAEGTTGPSKKGGFGPDKDRKSYIRR